jgi:hypothetical protein
VNEPTKVMVKAALDAMTPSARILRDKGWQAELLVHAPGEFERWPDQYTVSILVPLPKEGAVA